MDITEISPIALLFAVVVIAGILVFSGRVSSRWSRIALRIVSVAGLMLGCLLLAFLLLRGKPEERVVELRNDAFKILVRSQEFRHSGIRNIDICVAETSSRSFPKSRMQCFFHGFDFSGLSVVWQSQRDIEVSFRSGYLTYFENNATVFPTDGSNSESFHTTVRDGESINDAGKATKRLNVEF